VVILEFKQQGELWREQPIRLRVGEAEVLGWNSAPGGPFRPLPLVRTAFMGLVALRQVRRHGRYLMMLGRHGESGDLLFALVGDDVFVRHADMEQTGCAPITELEQSWSAFADRVTRAVHAANEPSLLDQLTPVESWRERDPDWIHDTRDFETTWPQRFEEYGWWPITVPQSSD
jgi:hypothetical protein